MINGCVSFDFYGLIILININFKCIRKHYVENGFNFLIDADLCGEFGDFF